MKDLPCKNQNTRIEVTHLNNRKTKVVAPLKNVETQVAHLNNIETQVAHLSNTEIKVTPINNVKTQISPLNNTRTQVAHLNNIETQVAPLNNIETQVAHLNNKAENRFWKSQDNKIKIALCGNPNSGKTTLFNRLTRSRQKVGNFAGVTVEKKEGQYYNDRNIEFIDLPGIYSLSALSQDERVTTEYLQNSKPDLVINVIDSTNLRRALNLTIALIKTGAPVLLALNMSDELQKQGATINTETLTRALGTPAILISARKDKDFSRLISLAQETVTKTTDNTATKTTNNTVAKTTNNTVAKTTNNTVAKTTDNIATKTTNNIEQLEDINVHDFIRKNIYEFITRAPTCSQIQHTNHKTSNKIDKIVLNKYLAFPIFVAVIFSMYFFAVQIVGSLSSTFTKWLIFDVIGTFLHGALTIVNSPDFLVSLASAVITGISAVLVFVPQIIALFACISFLEGCGYMSRVAVLMDRILRKLGLSGKSFVPMIVGCGCSVPAILSTKIIEDSSERAKTIMLTPFVPCSAKLPVFALLAQTFFPGNPFIAPSMYFLGIGMVIIGGIILKLFKTSQTSRASFAIELVPYRLPALRSALTEVFYRTRDFILRAGTIILVASILFWFLQTYDFNMHKSEIQNSMLANIGKSFAWIFAPLGFGNWQCCVALLSGIVGKELVVSTFSLVLGAHTSLLTLFTSPYSAYAFMAFVLLASPCIATLSVTKRELNNAKNFALTILFQCATAYMVAWLINLIAFI